MNVNFIESNNKTIYRKQTIAKMPARINIMQHTQPMLLNAGYGIKHHRPTDKVLQNSTLEASEIQIQVWTIPVSSAHIGIIDNTV